ncbi:MAG: NAD(P)H-dependent flavin oxidoreductase [Smithellaceae bacterium]
MRETRISRLLGSDYPIVQGGMLWLANAELAAAVSNAGGLGIISPYAGMKKEGDPLGNLMVLLNQTKALTNRAFGVNIPLDLKLSGALIDILLREKIAVVITAAGDPSLYTEVLHEYGIKVFHLISSVKQALHAELCGIDAVIAEGCEAAARLGFDELPLFSLIPQIVDAVNIPVIAAGGIMDGRGIAGAFALGAEGVQLGTRFIATKECIAHPNYKQAILECGDTDTVINCRKLLPRRSLKTVFTKQLLALENAGASTQELSAFLGYRRARTAQLEGNLDEGEVFCSASAGMIKEILPVSSLMRRLVEGYEAAVKECF